MKQIAIITNRKVDKTFEGEECLLKRTIVKTIKENSIKKYIILTERCNFYEEEQPDYDSDTGDILLDGKGDVLMKKVTILKTIGKKDSEAIFSMTFDSIDSFYENIKGDITENLSKMEKENLEEELALLSITKKETPWNTNSEDWESLKL